MAEGEGVIFLVFLVIVVLCALMYAADWLGGLLGI